MRTHLLEHVTELGTGEGTARGNLQLARGYERVLALTPIPSAVGPHPDARRQAAGLRAEGTEVTLVTPNAAARRAMGRDMTADTRRPAAARAGRAQGVAVGDATADVWPGR